MPSMHERITSRKQNLEAEEQARLKNEMSELEKQDAENKKTIEAILKDEIYLRMREMANSPELIDALETYFQYFPVIERKSVQKPSFFGPKYEEIEVKHDFVHTVEEIPYKTDNNGKACYEGLINVNGIEISCNPNKDEKEIYIRVVDSDYSCGFGNYSAIYFSTHSFEEFIDYIADKISKGELILGLRVNQS
jgi:hypothetical protein